MKNLQAVFDEFAKTTMFSGEKYVVGFSYGADSSVLLTLAQNYAKRNNIILDAVFFKHNDDIIKNEDEIETKCQKYCNVLDVNLSVINLDLSPIMEKNQSAEAAGHIARFAWFNNSDYEKVLLGHHLDDQCETIMMNIFRGAGRGMSGMKEVDSKIIRPLLKVSKMEILEYAKSNSIPWYDEPSNLDTYYTRNFWRNLVLPQIGEYYSKYREQLVHFAKKQLHMQEVAMELALIDGLEKLLNNEVIEVVKKESRIKNVVEQYLYSTGKSLQAQHWKQCWVQVANSKKFVFIPFQLEFVVKESVVKIRRTF